MNRDGETKIYGQARGIEVEIERCANKVSADEVRRRDKVEANGYKNVESQSASRSKETPKVARGKKRRKWQRETGEAASARLSWPT